MQNAQPNFRTRLPAHRPIERAAHRHRGVAHTLATCVFVAVTLVGASLAAQQVLMAPKVDLAFDSVEVTGQSGAVAVDYQVAANDWAWANDFGMDVWMGVYTPPASGSQDTTQWQLRQAKRLGGPQGQVSFESAVGADTEEFGVCMVVASVSGGKLAPGMGYVCETPLVVSSNGGRLELDTTNASVGLRFERNVVQQPWFTAERGFEQASPAASGAAQADGEFFSYRAPSPPEEARSDDARRGYDQRGYERRQRRFHGYPSRDMVIYTPGFLPGVFFDHDRIEVDRFRQRRLDRRQMFGPLDGFDAKFNQDMFGTHPEDVFYNSPIPPGYFGRDAFGRDLQNGFGAPPRLQRGLPRRGLEQPFD